MLALEHISFVVPSPGGSTEILKDISLKIEDKTCVVLTGPNGGGKTTLAKVIMGLVSPTEGRILWNGEDITKCSIAERAKLGISYGFQQPPRFKGMKVRDLLQIAAAKKLAHAEACSYLTKVGLCARDYLDRDVDASLSGGEVKRIEIATVLTRAGSFMIFDEPEAGIDLWSFARLTETFQAIRDDKKATVMLISHQERIIRLADEILLIADGRLQDRGSVARIFPKIMANTVFGCKRLEVDNHAQ